MPSREPEPYVGFSPTIPHRAAGWRIEPPVSVPSAHGARPAATAAALGPEDPPGARARSHGFSVGPNAEFSVDEPIANSSWFVFASSVAPAPVKRSTAVAVYGGRSPSRIREPDWLGTSRVQNRSLTASGTPASGPSTLSPASSATHVKQFSPSPRSLASASRRARSR